MSAVQPSMRRAYRIAPAVLGELLESASPSAGTKDQIITELARAVAAARAQAGDFTVTACGIAIPHRSITWPACRTWTTNSGPFKGLGLGGLLRELTGLPTYFIKGRRRVRPRRELAPAARCEALSSR